MRMESARQAVALDADGNVAIVGEFQQTVSFGGNNVTALGAKDIFVAKYDGDGNNLWTKRAGSDIQYNGDQANDISVDSSGNFYVTGDFAGTADFDAITITSINADYADIFIAKYAADGNVQWVHHAGGTHNDDSYEIASDAEGNSFISGFADSGPGVFFDNIELEPRGNEYIFLAKYHSDGAVEYVKQYAAGNGSGLTFTQNGCLFFTGGASGVPGNPVFDSLALEYVDRALFTLLFCESGVATSTPTIPASSNDLFVYPNPVSDHLNIQYASHNGYQIEMFDAFGRRIFHSTTGSGNDVINLSDFPSGTYFVKVISLSNDVATKMIQVVND